MVQVASSLHGMNIYTISYVNDQLDVLLILQSFEEDSSMGGNLRRVSNDIAEMCETWWNQDRPEKEQFVPQTISFLLIRALEVSGKVAGNFEAINQCNIQLQTFNECTHSAVGCF